MSKALEAAAAANLEAIQAAQDAEEDDGSVSIPILKVGEQLTKEVKSGDAVAGEFINSLTGEPLGTKIGFVVAFYQRGRFASVRQTGRAYTAIATDVIPEHWAEVVGEEFVGTPFAEHPDAEEKFKARVNAKEIPWGSGPLISTTYNYTGLAIVEVEDGEEDIQPVRLSLQRTKKPAHARLQSLKKMSLRNRPFWDKVFDLTTVEKAFGNNTSHVLDVKLGRDTTPYEKQAAVELATFVVAGRVEAGGEESDSPAAPEQVDGAIAL